MLSVTNTPLRLTIIELYNGGDLNGVFDTNECRQINLVLTNVFPTPLSGVTAMLLPRTPGLSITQPFGDYPVIPAGQRGTNLTPFQISLLPGYLCGTNIEMELVVHTPANGNFSLPFNLISGTVAPPMRFNNNTVSAIPDLGTLNSPVAVSGFEGQIKQVSVSMHITHTADNDLDISLIAPDGTTINLSSDNGGTASDYGTDCTDARRTTFTDTAATSILSGTAPFAGSFRPEQGLFLLNGKYGGDVNGIWTLRIVDDTGGAVGTLRCWSLFISGPLCTDGGGACESCPERTILGSISDRSSVQDGRLTRITPSSCATVKPCPGVSGTGTPRFFDAYTFVNGESNACITVSLSAQCNLFSAAYIDSYNPTNLCANYLADMGPSVTDGNTNSYSFNVDARARFVIVVNQVFPAGLCDYRLDVTGGSCRPVLEITETSPAQVLLDWSSSAIGYQLERTPSLSSPTWAPILTTPEVVNGENTITQPSTGARQFYRLRKP